jgi:hypothetical protein
MLIPFAPEASAQDTAQDTTPAQFDYSVNTSSEYTNVRNNVPLNGSVSTSTSPSFISDRAEGNASAASSLPTTNNDLFSHMGIQFEACSIVVGASIDDFKVSCDEVLMEYGGAARTIEELVEDAATTTTD